MGHIASLPSYFPVLLKVSPIEIKARTAADIIHQRGDVLERRRSDQVSRWDPKPGLLAN